MSAVLDKPRAKARPKAEKSALQARLDSIFAKLKLGQEKLQLAHHSVGLTDPGDAPEILLRAVIEDMLPQAIAPMYRQPLTRADVDTAYTGMFTSLAAIDGVTALSRGQVIEDTLRDAWALLDEANSLMDFTGTPGLPEVVDTAEADFLRGRDIAIKMIDEGSSLTGERECYRRHRDPGTAQDNFVNGYLSDIIAHPELREGFASVLSQMIGGGETFDGSYFKQLTLAETKGGELGEDGTQRVENEDAAEPSTEAAPAAFEALGIYEGPYFMVSEVIGIIQARLMDIGSDLLYGVATCAEKAKDVLSAGISARDVRMCGDASTQMAVTIAVLDASLEADDDVALWGALRLLKLAHEALDEAVAQGVAA